MDYSKVNSLQEQPSQWGFGASQSNFNIDSRTSDSRSGGRPYALQFVSKYTELSDRPILKATMPELFCYFRLYVTTFAKTQITTMFEGSINLFFWYNVQNLIFNSLPHVFVQMFLAVYVPEEHFYLNKMNPLLYGYNFIVILASFFELTLFIASNMILMDAFWNGITLKNPWNRCSPSYEYTLDDPIVPNIYHVVRCLTIKQFKKKVLDAAKNNQTLYFHKNEYYLIDANNDIEAFQIPQMIFFRLRMIIRREPFQNTPFVTYFLILWCLAALHHNQFFKRHIWRMIKYGNYAEFLIYVLITFYIFLSYNVTDPHLKKVNVIPAVKVRDFGKQVLDTDVISFAFNAPPVIHLLISRSTADLSKIHPISLSSMLVASNWIYNFLNGLMFKVAKDYCEVHNGVELTSTISNTHGFYYIYSIYFSYFVMGNIFFLITILVKCVSDFYVFVITYQSFVEVVTCEWRFMTRTILLIILSFMALITFLLLQNFQIILVYVYMKSIAVLIEVIGIYLMYPLGRLIEDFVFHSGKEPHTLQIWCLRLVPIFIGFEVYGLLETMFSTPKIFNNLLWCWFIPIVFLVAGVIYAMYEVYVHNQRCISLICPSQYWGPPDFYKRRSRTKYKKHEYIGSQADRDLSRYMLGLDDSEVFSLDVKYEMPRRMRAISRVSYEDEKKSL